MSSKARGTPRPFRSPPTSDLRPPAYSYLSASAGFTRAAAKGWAYAQQNPDKAVDLLVKAYPNLDRDAEMAAIKPVLGFSFTKTTAAKGWGTMEPGVWEQQLHIYDDLQQFNGPAPKVTDVMTDAVLKATAAARPKIGAWRASPPSP